MRQIIPLAGRFDLSGQAGCGAGVDGKHGAFERMGRPLRFAAAAAREVLFQSRQIDRHIFPQKGDLMAKNFSRPAESLERRLKVERRKRRLLGQVLAIDHLSGPFRPLGSETQQFQGFGASQSSEFRRFVRLSIF
jgi:hypothetical protein